MAVGGSFFPIVVRPIFLPIHFCFTFAASDRGPTVMWNLERLQQRPPQEESFARFTESQTILRGPLKDEMLMDFFLVSVLLGIGWVQIPISRKWIGFAVTAA